MCNVASCWIYEYIGILLGDHPVLHISRIRVKVALGDVNIYCWDRNSDSDFISFTGCDGKCGPVVQVKFTLVQALRLCTGCMAHRGE